MRALLCAAALFLAITASCLETKLLTPSELSKRVQMVRITDFSRYPLHVRTPDFVLASGDGDALYSVRGRDKLGRRWRVLLQDAVRGAWSSDAKGVRTYYFAGYTGGAGSAPYTWILALSFDERGRPVPFFVMTHGGYDDQGLEDVLDLDGTGPELLQQDYLGSIMDDPGYYVTTLYQLRGFYWYRSDGAHGTHEFPAFEKWSVMWRGRPAVLADHPPSGRPVRDSGNDPSAGVSTRIVGIGENAIYVSPEARCKYVSFGASVADSAAGREIVVMGTGEAFNRLAKAHAPVVLTGLHRWEHGDGCITSILWALNGR